MPSAMPLRSRADTNVHGPARGHVRAGDERRGAVQAPEAGPTADVLARHQRDAGKLDTGKDVGVADFEAMVRLADRKDRGWRD